MGEADRDTKRPRTSGTPEGDNLPADIVPTQLEKKKQWFVGSIDQGTTSTRFLIFDGDAAPVASHQVEITNHYEHSGWHEHDPWELLRTVQVCMDGATKEFIALGHSVDEIRSIGLTNQRETTVLFDKHTGEPLHNAIVWPDTRAANLVRDLKEREGADKLQSICGQPLSTYPSSVKLLWMLENVPEVKKAYDESRLCFGTVDTWLIYHLNGGPNAVRGPVYVTDPTNASRTMFMNLEKLDYDDELLNFFQLDRTKLSLPKIVPSSDSKAFGEVSTGLLKGVPIAGCLGDQSSALVGQCGFHSGHAKNTYGTGCFLLYNVGDKPVISTAGLLTTVAFDFGPGRAKAYALEGSVAVGGSGVTWLLNNIGIINSAKEVDDVATTVVDNGGVYFVTAFSGLFAPYWIDDAKGTLFGITAHTNRGHIARATLEATCHQTAAILDAMSKDAGRKLESLAVDGGLSNSDLCMQTQADISNIRVDRPAMRETTALGAAIAAGLATNVWEGLDDLTKANTNGRTVFSPKIETTKRVNMRKKWEQAVQMSKGWVTDSMGL